MVYLMKTKYTDDITNSIIISLKDIKAAADYFTIKGYDDEANSLKQKHQQLKHMLNIYCKAQTLSNKKTGDIKL